MNTPETFLDAFADHIRERFSDTLYCYAGYTGVSGALLVKLKRVELRVVLRPWLRHRPVGLQDITRSLERYKHFRGQLPNIHVHIASEFRDNAVRNVAQSGFQTLLSLDKKARVVAITGTDNLPKPLLDALFDFCTRNNFKISYDFVGTLVHEGRDGSVAKADPPPPGARNPRLFISYSWDGDAHKLWVLKLAADLTRSGVKVLIDEWDLPSFNDDLHLFMETGIRDSDYVLMVCTPEYARKANVRKGGVGVESSIITGEFYDHSKASKFIAIVRGAVNGPQSCLPTYMKSRFAIDFTNDQIHKTQFDALLRRLFRQPKYRRPDLGRPPDLGSQDI